MRRPTAPLPVLILSAWVLCGTSIATAQEERPDPSSRTVEVRIGSVVASSAGRGFDQRLRPLQRQFASLFAYSSYRLIKEERRRVEWRREAKFHLPGGRYLVVIPREYKDGRVAMTMMLIQGTRLLVNTAFALRDRGTFLVGGPHLDDGVLIITIGATTTPQSTKFNSHD